jgi:signal transduction histidine kinase
VLSLALGWLVAGRVLQPLEDSYHAQRQFVANASHELRTPLTRQRALIEVALAGPDADAGSLRRAHERVLASEQDLEQLIDALLALSRGQAGVERREHVDLAALASQAMHARTSELAGLDVDTTVEPAAAAGDHRLLERLIANLIDNAIRHNSADGRVEIATGVRDRHAFVSIANTGPAVPPEQVERLFQPFQRLGGARTLRDGGHGLGLSIVRAIADAHHAELTAKPRPEGGLIVDVTFPPAPGAGTGVALARARPLRGSPQ